MTSTYYANTENDIKREVETEVHLNWYISINWRVIISKECLGFAVFSDCSLGLHK